jgi:hypothetical protein
VGLRGNWTGAPDDTRGFRVQPDSPEYIIHVRRGGDNIIREYMTVSDTVNKRSSSIGAVPGRD